MLSNIKSHFYHWLFIGLFTATPFFLPADQVEFVPVNKGDKEIAGVGVGVRFGGGGYYHHRPYRYRYYPRHGYYYRHGYPRYYQEYHGPYYRDRYYYHRYPRSGGSIHFRVR